MKIFLVLLSLISSRPIYAVGINGPCHLLQLSLLEAWGHVEIWRPEFLDQKLLGVVERVEYRDKFYYARKNFIPLWNQKHRELASQFRHQLIEWDHTIETFVSGPQKPLHMKLPRSLSSEEIDGAVRAISYLDQVEYVLASENSTNERYLFKGVFSGKTDAAYIPMGFTITKHTHVIRDSDPRRFYPSSADYSEINKRESILIAHPVYNLEIEFWYEEKK